MPKIYEDARSVRDSISPEETVTLVGGCFDLLHVGHLHLLEYAKTLESCLVVCVLSDANTQSYKGKKRPVVPQKYRADMVSALGCVNRVYISDIDTSHQATLSVIRPNSVIFGIEDTDKWRKTADKRERFLRSEFPDIKIHYLERFSDPEVSTTNLIQRILDSG